jgi:hypothetical protein
MVHTSQNPCDFNYACLGAEVIHQALLSLSVSWLFILCAVFQENFRVTYWLGKLLGGLLLGSNPAQK